jgi:hypothetical protein
MLHFILFLLIVKAKLGWLDNSFNELLTLLAKLLPKPNFVPEKHIWRKEDYQHIEDASAKNTLVQQPLQIVPW